MEEVSDLPLCLSTKLCLNNHEPGISAPGTLQSIFRHKELNSVVLLEIINNSIGYRILTLEEEHMEQVVTTSLNLRRVKSSRKGIITHVLGSSITFVDILRNLLKLFVTIIILRVLFQRF